MPATAPTRDDVLERVDALGPPGTPVTTPEVAREFDCTKRTIYNRLDALVADGRLRTKKVGANSRVWWRPVDAATHHREAASGRSFDALRGSSRRRTPPSAEYSPGDEDNPSEGWA
ncbi:GAF, PAS/PAC domain protein / Bacterio-opsin activator domain-containing protein [Halorubrum sp. DM2]|uniref:helix-turn-helix transcriptional regulator n=1 Tax=Halorubrum sp. AJ67 TaxID=1173487 RepID=UPI0003DCEE20|nr:MULTISPECIES: helix-turn-helix transcriptional regulator [unclassified Halorubrum]CDK40734.1 PAS/PAC sensor protein domain protein [Halorubrum sp. AJ67]VTT88155.1 GAF, PAS/PAC domain protein / Bacterio-opsin activator domain-containing protein [Halorubrum sp. DM2]